MLHANGWDNQIPAAWFLSSYSELTTFQTNVWLKHLPCCLAVLSWLNLVCCQWGWRGTRNTNLGHKLCTNTLWYSLQIHLLLIYTHAGTHNAMVCTQAPDVIHSGCRLIHFTGPQRIKLSFSNEYEKSWSRVSIDLGLFRQYFSFKSANFAPLAALPLLRVSGVHANAIWLASNRAISRFFCSELHLQWTI